MVGDSLVRHATQALLTIMTGDFQFGGHTWWEQDKAVRAICQCDPPFNDLATTCRFNSISFYQADQRAVCPGWTRRRVIFHERTDPSVLTPNLGMTAGNDLAALLKDNTIARPFVYLTFGIHLQFERVAGRDGYLEPLWAMAESAAEERRRRQRRQQQQQQSGNRTMAAHGRGAGAGGAGGAEEKAGGAAAAAAAAAGAIEEEKQFYPPHILLYTFPYPGARKDLIKFPKQGRDRVERWNAYLRSYQADHASASSLIDYAPISDNSVSGDGTHFLQDTNMIMAQLVLNHVAAQIGVL